MERMLNKTEKTEKYQEGLGSKIIKIAQKKRYLNEK